MSSATTTGRFATLSEEEKCSLVTDKYSLKTKQATKFAVSTLRQYIVEKGHNENFEAFDRGTLDKTLRNFYSEMRNTKGESYKQSSLLAIRSGLARSSPRVQASTRYYKRQCVQIIL